MKRSDFYIAPYLRRSNARATWQLLSTFVPVALLWLIVQKIDLSSYSPFIKLCSLIPVVFLLALFSTRAFSLMHDCGHNSLFSSRWLNQSMGFCLGVLNAIPQNPWSRDHAFHHRHNGNWQIYRGPIDVLTVKDFQSRNFLNNILLLVAQYQLQTVCKVCLKDNCKLAPHRHDCHQLNDERHVYVHNE